MPLPLFDSHCHLQDVRIGAALGGMLDRARAAGVQGFVVCGCQPSDWDSVLVLAKEHGDVIPMLGLHPWFIPQAGADWLGRLENLVQGHPVGIGEVGLDFALETFDVEGQIQILRRQLRFARAFNRPLSIHCRKAWERLLTVLKQEGLPECGGVVHAFSGSPEIARKLQALGLHIGFGCALTNPTHRRAAKALAAVAPECLMFETDAPDMAPSHLPGYADGRLNEPANLLLVLEAAARLRGEHPGTLARLVVDNGQRVFGALRR